MRAHVAPIVGTDEWECVTFALQLCKDTVQWLEKELRQAQERGQEHVVVVTHHAPTKEGSSHPQFSATADLEAHCYEVELRHLFSHNSGLPVPLWLYGHTHYNRDDVVCGTRLVCNQLGRLCKGDTVELPTQDRFPFSPTFTLDLW